MAIGSRFPLTRTHIVVAGVLFMVCGCVQESDVNGERVFQYESWVPLSTLLAGLAATSAGWLLRKRTARLGWALIVVGLIAAIGFSPSLFRDRVSVSAKGFDVRTGIWGMTATHSLAFNEIVAIRLTSETTKSRRGQNRTNYFLTCTTKAGGFRKVPVNNAVSKASADAILQQAKSRGIPISDETADRDE